MPRSYLLSFFFFLVLSLFGLSESTPKKNQKTLEECLEDCQKKLKNKINFLEPEYKTSNVSNKNPLTALELELIKMEEKYREEHPSKTDIQFKKNGYDVSKNEKLLTLHERVNYLLKRYKESRWTDKETEQTVKSLMEKSRCLTPFNPSPSVIHTPKNNTLGCQDANYPGDRPDGTHADTTHPYFLTGMGFNNNYLLFSMGIFSNEILNSYVSIGGIARFGIVPSKQTKDTNIFYSVGLDPVINVGLPWRTKYIKPYVSLAMRFQTIRVSGKIKLPGTLSVGTSALFGVRFPTPSKYIDIGLEGGIAYDYLAIGQQKNLYYVAVAKALEPNTLSGIFNLNVRYYFKPRDTIIPPPNTAFKKIPD